MVDFWTMAWEWCAGDLGCDLSVRARRLRRLRHCAPATRARKKRKREEHKRSPVNEDEPPGKLSRWRFEPEKSPWWRLMERRGVRDVGTRNYLKFRRKFRLPLVTRRRR